MAARGSGGIAPSGTMTGSATRNHARTKIPYQEAKAAGGRGRDTSSTSRYPSAGNPKTSSASRPMACTKLVTPYAGMRMLRRAMRATRASSTW